MFYSLDKLKTKTKNQIFFVGENENLTTFLYILNRGDKKTFFFGRGKKVFLSMSTTTKKMGFTFSFWFSVYPTNRTLDNEKKNRSQEKHYMVEHISLFD